MSDRAWRWMRLLGAALWVAVAATVVADRGVPAMGAAWRTAWVVGFVAHLAAMRLRSASAGWSIATAVQIAAVLAMVVTFCHGFEGLLLIPIALQASLLLAPLWAAAGVTLQTVLFGAAVAVHWSASPAWMLAVPYGLLQALLLATGATLRREAEARVALTLANQHLRALGPVLEEGSRNAERVRISRELHDAAGHQITALALQLEVARHQCTATAAPSLEQARAITRELLDRLQELVTSSRRTASEELAAALRAMAANYPRPSVHLTLPQTLRVADAERAHVLLRCSQEILTNSARHSGAGQLWMALSQSASELQLVAMDDGRVEGPLVPGNGLRGMASRIESLGGTLAFDPASRRGGLQVHLRLPNPTE